MKKFISDFTVLSSALILLASVSLYLNYQLALSKNSVRTPSREVYKDDMGIAYFAQGVCADDADCAPAGCSKEVCTSKTDLITSCIYSESFPDKKIYGCGCVEKTCAWYKK